MCRQVRVPTRCYSPLLHSEGAGWGYSLLVHIPGVERRFSRILTQVKIATTPTIAATITSTMQTVDNADDRAT